MQRSTDWWKGRIVAEPVAACGNASCTASLTGKDGGDKIISETLQRLGWRRIKPYGLLCPDCVKEAKGAPAS